jgi:hypothetical protein
MSSRRFIWAVVVGNLSVALLAGLWGYTSYMYNWLNVGGGVADANFWDSMREAVPHVTLVAWAGLVVAVVLLPRKVSIPLGSQVAICIASFSAGPIVLAASVWFLHRGFPPPPL